MSRTWANITPSECLKFYKPIEDNSDQLWQSGLILGSQGFYGTATSVSIISIEELTKCLILCLDGYGYNFRTSKAAQRFFRDHGIRYVMAFAMVAIYTFGEDLISKIKEIHHNPGAFLKYSLLLKDEALMERTAKEYLEAKVKRFQTDLAFFSKMDEIRQKGFYCDHVDGFQTPAAFTEFDYQDARRRLEKVRVFGKELILALGNTDESVRASVLQNAAEFSSQNWYSKLSAVIDGKKTNHLFDDLQNFLSLFKH